MARSATIRPNKVRPPSPPVHPAPPDPVAPRPRRDPEDPRQLDLFLRPVVAEDGALAYELRTDRWSRHPYVKEEKDSLRYTRSLGSFVANSTKWKYIQPNSPTITFRLVLDVDRPEAGMAWDDAGLPSPNWIARNPANGHAHLSWEISVPVVQKMDAKNPRRPSAPMRLLVALESAYARQIRADLKYSGHFVKNPLHPSWDVHVLRAEPYDLSYLAEWVDLSAKVDLRAKPDLGTISGRNCYLFERLSKYAYREVRNHWRPGGDGTFGLEVEMMAFRINEEIEVEFPGRGPLDYPEMSDTVESIVAWVWAHTTPESFREYVAITHLPGTQAQRGRRSGAARKAKSKPLRERALELSAEGRSRRQIAVTVGVGKSTVGRWLAESEGGE